MGVPACLWRRTGEIYKGNREFSEFVGVNGTNVFYAGPPLYLRAYGRRVSSQLLGGGQSGLDVAARLKMLGMKTLVVEKNERIGDNWRKRYAALCLHDPVWYDHMPYLPFPVLWPVYMPALKLADWLESYAHSMELDVWTSATVMSVIPGAYFEVNHVVFASGFGSGMGQIPDIPGQVRPIHECRWEKYGHVASGSSQTYLDLDIPVNLFQHALDLRPTGHPD
ncbi:hypothetical protein CY34DRAFT_9210 [Suillus luteus UH-Slu-Lm8-n1]|uniref:Uncharacterized protein n=1 Tax=Suillus luteus UH-Slu-Lm8-n1 TaxID=930992 RepID=A0A0D0BMY0_9AGAM|nr:hypothetical protein CY34DRAFT_9210 [Suillus luteus UH-Slu-Lm8-n1]